MINNKLLLVTGVVTLSASFFSGTLTAANVATGNASADILQPISIVTGANDMDFGDIVPDVAAADVVLSATGAGITASGGATTSGTATAGDFTVTGDNVTFTISVPADFAVDLTGPGSPGTDMALKSFTTDQVGDVGTIALGTAAIRIGATLEVGTAAAQTVGAYTGTYDITVNYQ